MQKIQVMIFVVQLISQSIHETTVPSVNDTRLTLPNGFDAELSTNNSTDISTEANPTNDSGSQLSTSTIGLSNDSLTVTYEDDSLESSTSVTVHRKQNSRPNPFAIIHTGMVSESQYQKAEMVITVVLKPIVCVCGLVLNFLGIFVLLQNSMRQSTYIYLCGLCISDSGYLICEVIESSTKMIKFFDVSLSSFVRASIFGPVELFLENCFLKISSYIICVVSLERLLAVCFPLKVRDSFLSKQATLTTSIIVVFTAAFYSPFLFSHSVLPYKDAITNVTMYAFQRAEWARGSEMSLYNEVNAVAHLYLPPLVLVVSNAGILIRLATVRKARRNLFAGSINKEATSHEQKRITTTLLVISGLFLIVYLPAVITMTLMKHNPKYKVYKQEHFFIFTMSEVTSLGWCINSSMNFIIYIATSKRFRATFFNMCGRNKGISITSRKTRQTECLASISGTDSGTTNIDT